MIYLIGGPARAGKSTLARNVRKEIDGQIISGDAFHNSLLQQMVPEWYPALFEHIFDDFSKFETNEMKVMRLRRRDEAMWGFYWRYAECAVTEENDDVLLDGNLWPDFIHTLLYEHKAVFLVDTSSNQADRLKTIRDAGGSNDWMQAAHYTNEHIERWAEFNILRGRLTADLCKKYDYPCFDIKDHGMDGSQRLAFDYLLGRKRV